MNLGWIIRSNTNIILQPAVESWIKTWIGNLLHEVFHRVLIFVRVKFPSCSMQVDADSQLQIASDSLM